MTLNKNLKPTALKYKSALQRQEISSLWEMEVLSDWLELRCEGTERTRSDLA